MGEAGALMKQPNFALKFVELILAGISIGVVIDGYPVADTLPKLATVYGTQIGFIMISLILVLSFLMGSPMHKTILVLIGVAGICMWATTGGLIVHAYQSASFEFWGIAVKPEERMLVSGVVALVNAVVYLVDTGLTIKK